MLKYISFFFKGLFTVLLLGVAFLIIVPVRPILEYRYHQLSNLVGEEMALRKKFDEPLTPLFNAKEVARSTVTVVAYNGFLCPEVGRGTGFFLGDRTSIITAWHVMERAGNLCQLSVILANGRTIRAQKWQGDSYGDVARVRLFPDTQGLRELQSVSPLRTGDPAALRFGDPLFVLALNRLNLLEGRFLTRNVCLSVPDALFFTNNVRQGDSGSPLLNRDGAVVGIVKGASKQNLSKEPFRVSSPLGLTHLEYSTWGCAVSVPALMK